MTGTAREATHRDPIWRAQADFILAAPITGHEVFVTEQLWGRQIDEYRFEVCCVPFFVSDFALGDVVETDGSCVVTAVVQPSGRYVFRVWFVGVQPPPRRDR